MGLRVAESCAKEGQCQSLIFRNACARCYFFEYTCYLNFVISLLAPHRSAHFLSQPLGVYIVRLSPNLGTPVISLSCEEGGQYKVANFQVVKDKRNQYYLYDKTENNLKFPTLESMLDHYKNHNPQDAGGLPHQLKRCLPFSRAVLGR
jgi:hypothetical protein